MHLLPLGTTHPPPNREPHLLELRLEPRGPPPGEAVRRFSPTNPPGHGQVKEEARFGSLEIIYLTLRATVSLPGVCLVPD